MKWRIRFLFSYLSVKRQKLEFLQSIVYVVWKKLGNSPVFMPGTSVSSMSTCLLHNSTIYRREATTSDPA